MAAPEAPSEKADSPLALAGGGGGSGAPPLGRLAGGGGGGSLSAEGDVEPPDGADGTLGRAGALWSAARGMGGGGSDVRRRPESGESLPFCRTALLGGCGSGRLGAPRLRVDGILGGGGGGGGRDDMFSLLRARVTLNAVAQTFASVLSLLNSTRAIETSPSSPGLCVCVGGCLLMRACGDGL